VRAAVARYLDGCPVADDAVLVVSEIAANAVLHSQSSGEFFTVRCELYPDYVWVECEDLSRRGASCAGTGRCRGAVRPGPRRRRGGSARAGAACGG